MKTKKEKINFVCTECGYNSLKWFGKCPSCDVWGSLKEFKESKLSKSKIGIPIKKSNPVKISDIEVKPGNRVDSGYDELNRVLGGGIVNGMTILIGGDPGIGKSTIMLQLTASISDKYNNNVVYVSGEESLSQIKMRAHRLNCGDKDFLVLTENNLESILDTLDEIKPAFVVIDSIQTIESNNISSPMGSVSQLRETTSALIFAAKKNNFPLFLVGHVTKDGSIAGPKVIEHMVDTVLYFEGDKYFNYRILRTVKNRFGSTNEIGIFDMKKEGLCEVKNPSEIFLNSISGKMSGTSVTATLEGTRTFLVEIQALVSKSNYGTPQRNSTGIDLKRVHKITAVLEKRSGINFGADDIFLNVAGGTKLDDPAADLSIAVSLFSSLVDIELSLDMVFVGEIGLGGEIRNVSNLEFRIKEAQKLGFKKIFVPAGNKLNKKSYSIEILEIKDINELLRMLK